MDVSKDLYRISELLSRFVEQIKILNKNEEFGLNHHAEFFYKKVFKIIFDCQDIKREKKNYPGIDLSDENKRIAFQITSTSNIEKIKHTIEQFILKQLFNKFDTLFIFIISQKEKKYNQNFIDTCLGEAKRNLTKRNPKLSTTFKFDVKKNILDKDDLYTLIKELNDDKKIFEIKEILEEQFSDHKRKKNYAEQIEIFTEEYKSKIINDFSRINFFGLDLPRKPREIQLYSLFVEPYYILRHESSISTGNFEDITPYFFSQVEEDKQIKEFLKIEDLELYLNPKYTFFENVEEKKLKPYSQLFKTKRNKIIIGNPGAGKSLLIKHAICKILEKDTLQFDSSFIFDYLPIRIELFKYNKDRNNKGIENYLQFVFTSIYGFNNLFEEIIQNMFEERRTIVFFDGLDEIFDVQERTEVRNQIENFTKKYEKSISIVTSRFESFEEVSFDSSLFDIVEIVDFNAQQITEYVIKWYNIEETNEKLRREEIATCLEHLSKVDNDLIKSPLLLSLILILYRNELDIPTTKLEIYESCTNTLVETRDAKEKKLNLNLQIKNKVSAFAHIAFWQFNLQLSEAQKKGINYKSVLLELTKFLLGQKNTNFQDESEANAASKEFLEYAKNRSIYVENSFTHKSFFEYFTAYYLFANYYNKGDHEYINNIFTENISKSAWFVVLELLICKIDSGQPDTDIIDGIIDNQCKINGCNALAFFLQILNQLRNISTLKENELIAKTIEIIIEENNEHSNILFDHLMHFSNNVRYNEMLSEQFEIIIKKKIEGKLNIRNCYVLYLEAIIVSGNKKIFKIEFDKKNFIDPYIFILENYTQLFDWDKFFELLKQFISTFGMHEVSINFPSLSNSKLFLGNTNFNWIVYSLLSFNNRTQFLRNYSKLKNIGINKNEILRIVNLNKLTTNMNTGVLNRYYNQLKDPSIREFLNQLSKKLFDKTCQAYNEKDFYGRINKINKHM